MTNRPAPATVRICFVRSHRPSYKLYMCMQGLKHNLEELWLIHCLSKHVRNSHTCHRALLYFARSYSVYSSSMARGGILLLLALLSGATTTIPSAKAQQQQVASNSTSDVQVATIDVEGEVMMYISHKHALSNETELEPTQRSELTYKLFDTSPSDAPRDFLTVDFGETSASLRTGDVVNARLTLNISADMAAQLDLTTSGLDNSSSRRRRLSEMHDAARRMVLDLHGTRRSVQEVLAVREALHRIGMTSFGLKSEATSVIGRASGKDLLVTNDMQQNMSSITFVVKLSACGMIPALNASRVAEFLFDNSKINGNLERWYKVSSEAHVLKCICAFACQHDTDRLRLDIYCARGRPAAAGSLAAALSYSLRVWSPLSHTHDKLKRG
ncbi:hypothetical protein PLESTB_001431000 [Pleodorina starrii]|uniref:Uncharacterized protein n=1 Tax=Pleodorina starrii TaxID=330485 RepID=A0A9W6F7T7_9CHLO|nr:hypothetical protein PLESTB_001431000 [Pleodorina starrii]